MRQIALLALLLAACSEEPRGPPIVTGTFAGEGRDRLCVEGAGDDLRAGVIVYGDGDSNCSASGRLEMAGAAWVLIPRGEDKKGCRIPLTLSKGLATIGTPPSDCAYYCGPDASMTGKAFRLDATTSTATDLGGDPLC